MIHVQCVFQYPSQDGKRVARQEHMSFFEVSAKTGDNVSQMFESLGPDLLRIALARIGTCISVWSDLIDCLVGRLFTVYWFSLTFAFELQPRVHLLPKLLMLRMATKQNQSRSVAFDFTYCPQLAPNNHTLFVSFHFLWRREENLNLMQPNEKLLLD